MCLYNDKKAVAKFLKKHKNHKTVTCYKRLQFKTDDWGNILEPKVLQSPYYSKTYKIGINKSNSSVKKPVQHDIPINRGIHVYLRRQCSTNLAVICAMKDLIGVSYDQAVFSQITLSEKEYNKGINNHDNSWKINIKRY